MDNTQRFTSRVQDYQKARPGYPDVLYNRLISNQSCTSNTKIADVGSGTGLLSLLFLKHGHRVWGVEPNDAMRAVQDELQTDFDFISVNGQAEDTSLEPSQVGLIVVGQAFHWFDVNATKQEFRRILQPNGHVLLAWNVLNTTRSESAGVIGEIWSRFIAPLNTKTGSTPDIEAFYAANGFKHWILENRQTCDKEVFTSRFLSSSNAPQPGHADYEPLLAAVASCFEKYQEDDQIHIEYHTHAFIGAIHDQK